MSLIAKATPAPWFYDSYSKVWAEPDTKADEDADPVFKSGKISAGDTATPQGAADCELIVLLRNLAPRLIAAEEVAEAVEAEASSERSVRVRAKMIAWRTAKEAR